jgi:mannan endo-1,4-beta-mannosidase
MSYLSPNLISLTRKGAACVGISLLLSACGGGGGDSSPAPKASSAAALSSTPASSVAPSSTPASSVAPASLNSSSSSAVASSALAASSSAALVKCTVDGKQWNVCATDNGSWNFESGQYCVAQSFCPSNRTQLPSVALRSAPIDPAANTKTQALYSYLQSIWGQKTLTGQQDLTWKDSVDMAERVHTDTGKYPAMMGYDFMNYGMTASWAEGRAQTEEAIAYAQKGGLISFAWHWRDPALLNTANVNGANFYAREADASKNTNFQIPIKDGALDTSSAAYDQLNAGIDLIALELQKLSEAGVSILWRPLHEASGYNGDGWFWWGRTRTDGVPQSYAQILLWRHMYERLTQHHQLHNLLWVWNGQNAAWYPGDLYVDIVSHDIYDSSDNKTYKSQLSTFTQASNYPFEQKMVALSENSFIPDPDKIANDKAWWLWFMVWNDSGDAGVTSSANFWSGDYYNTSAHKTKVYNHANMITLDELPAL